MAKHIKSDVLKAIICRKVQKDGFAVICIDGSCMAPVICDGEMVVIVKSNCYQVGDVVLVYVSKSLRVHRIVKLIGDTCITKGDHAVFVDPIDQHKPEIIGLVSENITKRLTCYRVPLISRLISYLSLFASSVRKRFKMKIGISFINKIINLLSQIELCYLKYQGEKVVRLANHKITK